MKKKFLAFVLAAALVLVLLAGCSGGKDQPPQLSSDAPIESEGDGQLPASQATFSVSEGGLTEAQSPTGASDSVVNSILDVIAEVLENSPSAEPEQRQEQNQEQKQDQDQNQKQDQESDGDNDFAAVKYVEPPILLSAEYFGSGIDAKFSLSVILPESVFDFQGSFHGSAEATLEVSYRDVGGAWLDWDEQKVDLWRIDRTTQALSFLYPAVNMIPRTEFRVKLTYRYVVDSGDEFTISSAWSATADTMPDGLPPDDSEAFVGQWHSMNMLAAGWDERYAFHADGTYIYASSQIKIETNIIYISGTWSVYNGGLAMFAESILSMEGAQIIHDENFGDSFEGGKPELTVIEYPERSMCQIERGDPDPESGRRTIKINGATWYNFDEHDEFSSFFEGYDYFIS